MHERMMNKAEIPTDEQIRGHLGEAAYKNLTLFNSKLSETFDLTLEKKFPFGNEYGWGYRYSVKKKQLIYLFFERGSLNMMIRVDEPKNEKESVLLNGLSAKGKECWKNKYPCGNGGWIHYRIITREDLKDAGIFLSLRTKKNISF